MMSFQNPYLRFQCCMHTCFTTLLYSLPTLRVFENRILRSKCDEIGEWRRVHTEELHSPNIVMEIQSRRLRLVGHVSRMEEGWVLSKFY